MPEGPEIRRAADRVHRAIGNKTCTEVYFAFPHLKDYENELTGAHILEVTSRGKALLTRFANGWTVYSHNQLYGVWRVCRIGKEPATRRQLRLAIRNESHAALLYSASDIEVLRREEESEHRFLSRLGPDLLDETTTAELVLHRLLDKAFCRRSLGALLLDQSFVAGLGNYLRSEVLFLGKTMPTLRPVDCQRPQLVRIAELCLNLARQSYRTRGLTNDLQLAATLKARGLKRAQYRHWVFARAGQPCWQCGAHISSMTSSGRRLFYCPCCQRAEA